MYEELGTLHATRDWKIHHFRSMETVAKIANMVASHWIGLFQALLLPLLILDVKEAWRVGAVIQNLHVEDRCRQMSWNMKMAFCGLDFEIFESRGWGGLLVARLHYLSPHLLNILADFATIAAPTTNWLVVFQVEINVSDQANLIF